MDDKTQVFHELRPLLFSIGYRILSVKADTEDVLQEAYLRWQAAPAESIRSPKAFLTTVVSRLALDALKAAHRKREVYLGPWLPEPIIGPVTEPVELAESLSFAFLRLLESLGPAERVAFLMREVFEAEYSDVAEALETSESNARQLVSRARGHLKEGRTNQVNRARHPELLAAFLQACAEGDSGALVILLKEDAVLFSDGGGRTRAALNPIFGSDRIIRFVFGLRRKGLGEYGGYPAQVNGLPGAVITLDGKPNAVLSIAVEGDRIRELYFVLNPEKLGGIARNPDMLLE
jgi:RNA polymerase sigma-70 factor, ECF subfamily